MQFLLFGVYAAILIAIAIYSSKRTSSLKDFFLGGRNVGPWMSAFAYGTTYFSAVIFIGYAGRFGWNFGLSAVWIGIGNALIGSLLAWLVLAKKTRRMTHELGVSTMPEFFEARFGSRNLKIFSALLIFVFMVPYSASVYQGLSYLFEAAFGIPFIYCILGMAVLTAIYLVMGGYFATALSDFFQGIIMIVGVALVIVKVVSNPAVGGFAAGMDKLFAVDPDLTSLFRTTDVWKLISLVLLTSLGSWGLPQMIHKFYAIRDEKSINKATVISTLFALVVGGGAYFLGVFGRLYMQEMPANVDSIVPTMLNTALLGSVGGEILLGVVVILVLSASMSTLSSVVLTASSALSMDLIKGVFCPAMPEKKVKLLMRVLCGAFVAVSVLLAVFKIETIVTLMSISWGTLSGAFLGPFLLGLWNRRTGKAAAWAGMLTGFGAAVLLNLLPRWGVFTFVDSPTAGVIAMVLGVAVTFAVTVICPQEAPAAQPQITEES
ncbi:MAG: sodium/solute symporter [Eubacteriales bacterium]|nr:sodium/solute symporter [Eubacteriales bacterium]